MASEKDGRIDERRGPRDTTAASSVITSRELLGKRRQLRILHNDEQYTLRITANNKLILTK